MNDIASLKFPVVGLGPSFGAGAKPGGETLDVFFVRQDLAEYPIAEIKLGVRNDMILADSARRFWKIVHIHELDPPVPLWRKIIGVVWWTPNFRRVSYQLEAMENLSWEEFKERVCASIDSDADLYCDAEDFYRSHDLPSTSTGEECDAWIVKELEKLKRAVRAASTVGRIAKLTYPDGK